MQWSLLISTFEPPRHAPPVIGLAWCRSSAQYVPPRIRGSDGAGRACCPMEHAYDVTVRVERALLLPRLALVQADLVGAVCERLIASIPFASANLFSSSPSAVSPSFTSSFVRMSSHCKRMLIAPPWVPIARATHHKESHRRRVRRCEECCSREEERDELHALAGMHRESGQCVRQRLPVRRFGLLP